MFSFFTGKKEPSQAIHSDPNIRLYENVMDKKLTPAERIAYVKANQAAGANGLYTAHENKNVFNLAYAMQDIETFTHLSNTFTVAAAFNPLKGKNWLTLALDAKKTEFIQAFFESRQAFTENDVTLLGHESIDEILTAFVTALTFPRLYHLIELMLTKAILPIIELSDIASLIGLQAKLDEHYPTIFKTLAFQAGTPPTKSTQLLGLLIKHGFIRQCKINADGTTTLAFKTTKQYGGHKESGIDQNGYYQNIQYLLTNPLYHRDHAVLLHCHHYFVVKQEAVLNKKQKYEFDKKLNALVLILDLIKNNPNPATDVKEYIETMCRKKTGESHFRDTIYPLASMDDAALKASYEYYLFYINHENGMVVRNQNTELNINNLTIALYAQRSNPFTKLHDYFEKNPDAKNIEEKKDVFLAIQAIMAEEPMDREKLKNLSFGSYASTPQIVSPPKMGLFSPSLAHPVYPRTGQFADLVRGLKHWDESQLKKKYEEYQNNQHRVVHRP